MAACDQGYLCDVCGEDVSAITESSLYLRYVLGDVSPLQLPRTRERHLRCHAELAQYIVDAGFEPILCEGFFAKDQLDADFARGEEARVTRGWRRLQEIPTLGISIPEYPLPEVQAAWCGTPRMSVESKNAQT